MPNDPEATVRDYFRLMQSWSEDTLQQLLDCFTEDAVWHNMPLEPTIGKPAIEVALRRLAPISEDVTIEINSLVAKGTTVFVERVDTHIVDGKKIVIPACGVFEIRDGLIATFRDYFDMRTYLKQGGV